VLVIFQSPDRVSPGMRQRADELGIEMVNVRTETLKDTLAEIQRLGELIGESEKAAAFVRSIEGRMAKVEGRVAGQPPVRTLIVMNEQATFTVGRGNFLNDVLEIAGGVNVIEAEGWPTLDH